MACEAGFLAFTSLSRFKGGFATSAESFWEHFEVAKEKTADIADVTKGKALNVSDSAIEKASELKKQFGNWLKKDKATD